MLKTLSFIIAVFFSTTALATVITMTLVDEYEVKGHKKVCVYEGGNSSAVVIINASRSCPSKKTFGKEHE